MIGFGNSNEDGSSYNAGGYNGYARRNRLVFHNSTVALYNTARGLHFGARNIANQSFSNRVDVTGTSGNLDLRRIQMRGFADVFHMEGGSVNINGSGGGGLFMSGEFNRFENAGGTLTIGDNGVQLSNHGNVFENCGGTLGKSATVGGVSNRIELTSGTISGGVTLTGGTNLYVQTGGTASGATTLNGMANRLELAGGTRTGAVTLNGTNGVFRLSGGLFQAKLAMNGISNLYENASGVSTSMVAVAGLGNTLVIGPGTELYNKNLDSNTQVNGLSFSGATSCTLVISNGTFISRSSLAGASGSKPAWWINCPGSAIEFRGRNPSFVFPQNGSYYHPMYIGRDTEAYPEDSPLPDPVRLRFVPPADNFAAAPLRNETTSTSTQGNYCIRMCGNAVIEVSDKELPPRSERTSKIRVPLIYCRNSFGGRLGDATRMERLNANAILPEGAKLVYDSSAKTLYCELAPKYGTMIFIR